jgi:hypothetical protein
VKTNKASAVPIYDSLNVINRSFEQIIQELERLRQVDCFRGRTPINPSNLP